jgi:hypothetical protein
MRVIHVAPTALGASGLFGGGERYPIEPAPASAGLVGVDRELVTVGRSPGVRREPSGVLVRVRRPVAHLPRSGHIAGAR